MKGFTLLEVLVSLTLITVGILGVLGLMAYVLTGAKVSYQKLIAVQLAQEGVELVRNIRDINWRENAPKWDDGIKGTGGERAGIIDYNDTEILTSYFNPPYSDVDACGENCRLYWDGVFYSHQSAGQPTNFYRLILLESIAPDQIKVISQVKWSEQGRNHYVEVTDYLYDWWAP